MPRYDRSYDYGLRGMRETARGRAPRVVYGSDYRGVYDERAAPRYGNRVTARYNMDYVYGARGDRSAADYGYPRNFHMYTGDRMDRMGDERYYRQPYMTTGGTRTLRGSNFPTGYDYPDYGPDYGGRFRNEV